jgi:hypothetical protein
MNSQKKLIWILGLGIASALGAFEMLCPNCRAETSNGSSATVPTNVWDSTATGTTPAIPTKLERYAERLVKKYDRNGSGALEENEWAGVPGDLRKVHRNRDGAITVEALADYLATYARSHPLQDEKAAWQHLPRPPAVIFHPVTPVGGPRENPAVEQAKAPGRAEGAPSAENAPSAKKGPLEGKRGTEASRDARKFYVAPSALPPGLPDWFRERDVDGDGQLTLSEFAPDGSAAQRQLFAHYDQNGDGVITPEEVLHSLKTAPEKGKPSTAAKEPAEKKTSSSSAREPHGGSRP